MKKSTDLKSTAINASVFLYFLALIIVNQFGGSLVSIIWDLSLLLAAIMGLYAIDFRLKVSQAIFLSTILITGVFNEIVVGTTTHNNQILLILFALVSYALISPYVNENSILVIIFLNAVVVVYKFLTVGFTGMIFMNSSSNFVSVQLLYPTVVYYAISENKEQKLNLIPAVIVWVLSLLSRGRGGIISTTILLIGLVATLFGQSKSKRKIIFSIIGITLVCVVILNLDTILARLNSSVISEYFRARGLESSRTWIWADYLNSLDNFKYLMCGGDLSRTYAGNFLDGNLHNSFLNIHLQNGFVMLFVVAFLAIRRLFFGIKEKKYVYAVCLFSILVRAFTDNVFWPAYGTPVLFFILFFSAPENRTKIKFHFNH